MDLGALGFWLMVGMVLAASIVSGAIRERDKEREKQAMLRALLEKEGNSVTEVLAYLREKDATEAAAVARIHARSRAFRKTIMRRSGVALGIFAVVLGIYVFLAVYEGVMHGEGSIVLPLVALLGIWAAGLTVAWLMWRSGKQTHDAHPDA